ncbi:hypothetical protein Dsin_016374 [Dipteronia sinensis]|uniref:Reverse transcriptase zinc-binding domain-containing protein n=1 Tax=Dipteronia sinensis TaxID=43782 RepID=A0AAE0ADS2_9ROSI|nr:hypothetical protein Dsin_016374 [Dipteronia sinensis]
MVGGGGIGLFIVGSFRKGLETHRRTASTTFKEIWQGICPPKIEIILWQLQNGRVMVKDVMKKCGYDQFTDMRCCLCDAETEMINHVFLLCRWTWSIWEEHISWECRDQIVFKGSRPSTEQTIYLIKFRCVWWFKHFKKGSHELVTTLLLNLKDLCVEKKKQKSYQLKDWIPPAVESLKFNVDGSSKGNPGSAGIR